MNAISFAFCLFFIFVKSNSSLPQEEIPHGRALEYSLKVKSYHGSTTEKPSIFQQIADSVGGAFTNAYDKMKNLFTFPEFEDHSIYPGYYLSASKGLGKHQEETDPRITITKHKRRTFGKLVEKEIPTLITTEEAAKAPNSEVGYLEIKVKGITNNNNPNKKLYHKKILNDVKKLLDDSIRMKSDE